MKDKYITVSQAGKLLELTPARIYQLIKKYKVKHKYRRGVMICKESDILKLDEPMNK